MWKESCYNVYLPHSNDDALVVNTFRRSVIRIPTSLVKIIRQKNSTYSSIGQDDLLRLAELGIIVPSNTNEAVLFNEWYGRISSSYSHIRVTIALTSACNLNCAYCFEKGALRNKVQTMSEKVANQAVSWLAQLNQYVQSESIFIVFYGGEPTLVPERMLQFIQKGQEKLGPQSEIYFGMYSNGVSFSDELLPLFSRPDFRWAQIALDGTCDVHNKRRVFNDGGLTFNRIWKNIETLVIQCNVFVRIAINFDRTNFADIPQLLKEIARSDFKHGVEITFNPIFNTGLNNGYCSGHNFPERESYDLWRKLYENAIGLGLQTPFLRLLDKGPCAIHREGNFYIAPSGVMFECIGLLGIEKNQTGDVRESFSPSVLLNRKKWILNNTQWSERCNDCVYLPICLGGCRFKALCETGDLKGDICHKDLIERCELPLAQWY